MMKHEHPAKVGDLCAFRVATGLRRGWRIGVVCEVDAQGYATKVRGDRRRMKVPRTIYPVYIVPDEKLRIPAASIVDAFDAYTWAHEGEVRESVAPYVRTSAQGVA